ncbi:hypothetical protein ACFV2U_54250 [Streptomyces sp. NPDC059697]|uniref:hypothetical protein n=1 Tax=Streptomyces sp. NPDC059697 TaxID=3346912 RepID=UPI003681D633
MAEFLRRLLTDEELQEETIGVVLPRALLHQLAWEKRRWEASLDPSTGEPW